MNSVKKTTRKKSAKKKTVISADSQEKMHSDPSVIFGMEPEESSHYFLINLGDKKGPQVYISEHFEYFENPERQRIEFEIKPEHPAMRVILSRNKWDQIQDVLRFEFNQRLKRAGIKTSKFKEGYNIVPRLFGKELILLCWAIEDADPGQVSQAIKNWQGLKPEERWWLFTMTNAATGHALKHRNIGWRKAVRFALTENPVEMELHDR